MLPSLAARGAALTSAAVSRSMTTQPSSAALAAIVYVSEGRDPAALATLGRAARDACAVPGVALGGRFVDAPYHRSSYTLVGGSAPALAGAAARLAGAALAALDLRAHDAAHPRLGTVDHISCHPLSRRRLACAQLGQAAELARHVGEALAAGPEPVSVFYYGAACPEGTRLADLRRRLGYFSGSAAGSWSGVCCIGATPWVVNFNVLLSTADLAVGRQVAAAVSERAGGLAGVQAMALRHADGVEVACNLLDHEATPPAAVEAAVAAAAAKRGVSVASSYQISRPVEELLALLEGSAQ